MTTLLTALGLLPLAVGIHESGREIEGAMAVAILGGLLSSMALNLVVLPALAVRFGRFRADACGWAVARHGYLTKPGHPVPPRRR